MKMFSAAIFAALVASVAAVPLSLGSGALLGINLNPNELNACLFANLATLQLKPNTALVASSNTCISVDDCLSVKTREVVFKPVLAGLVQVGFCQTKTCLYGEVLNSAGVCVALNVTPPKTCGTGFILNPQGVCICAPGFVFADSKKEVCISTADCDLKLNTVAAGVCLPKVCSDGKLLSSQLGLCIDASLCSLHVNGLCKEITCPANTKLDYNTGLCVSLCSDGLLSTPTKQCISVAACSPVLNTIVDGKCVPKACNSNLLTINANGICACLPGFALNKAGVCALVNIL